ncbi:MAG: drug:proton antiporter [Caulobacteraceae bacterium]|nr:MAG: drug:proton antiporter [Caulobacteraceae bacterium]
MPAFSFLLLHVADHAASARFYNRLLGLPILEQKDGFSTLPLRDGVMLGLWERRTVEPASSGQTGASEVALSVAGAAAVEALHADWSAQGLPILQALTLMSFGTTFVAEDPDGHRLRVFAPPGA